MTLKFQCECFLLSPCRKWDDLDSFLGRIDKFEDNDGHSDKATSSSKRPRILRQDSGLAFIRDRFTGGANENHNPNTSTAAAAALRALRPEDDFQVSIGRLMRSLVQGKNSFLTELYEARQQVQFLSTAHLDCLELYNTLSSFPPFRFFFRTPPPLSLP
jgi:hypothetical protein